MKSDRFLSSIYLGEVSKLVIVSHSFKNASLLFQVRSSMATTIQNKIG